MLDLVGEEPEASAIVGLLVLSPTESVEGFAEEWTGVGASLKDSFYEEAFLVCVRTMGLAVS